MEFKLMPWKAADPITFNYAELKADVINALSQYKDLVYTEDKVQEAKADLAKLRKTSKALSDERIRIEKEFKKPLESFSSQVKEICGLIGDVCNEIDTQVKGYAEKGKGEKLEAIRQIYSQYDMMGVPLEQILEPSWMNKSTTLKAIEELIGIHQRHMKDDLQILEQLYPDDTVLAKEHYLSCLNISETITFVNDIKKMRESIKEKTDAVVTDPLAEPNEEEPTWITFSAYVTVSQAKELGDYCRRRGIKLKKGEEE